MEQHEILPNTEMRVPGTDLVVYHQGDEESYVHVGDDGLVKLVGPYDWFLRMPAPAAAALTEQDEPAEDGAVVMSVFPDGQPYRVYHRDEGTAREAGRPAGVRWYHIAEDCEGPVQWDGVFYGDGVHVVRLHRQPAPLPAPVPLRAEPQDDGALVALIAPDGKPEGVYIRDDAAAAAGGHEPDERWFLVDPIDAGTPDPWDVIGGGRDPVIRLHYTAPPPVTVRWDNDEHVTILAGDREVFTANHDEHGWDGMHAVIDLTRALADVYGAEPRTEGTPNL